MGQSTDLININRFSGFADIYSNYRPVVPSIGIEIILKYLGRTPRFVVDLGCGPGLSTFPWAKYAKRVIGIEPNRDMLDQALENLRRKKGAKHVSIQFGYSNQTGVKSNSVDIVTCSQSFHWMEPKSTIREISRVLAPGGIFAAVDYDWPPTVDWIAEQEFRRFTNKVNRIQTKYTGETRESNRWNKDRHLTNLRESNQFRFVKEVLFHHRGNWDADRFIGLALSLGTVQRVLKEYRAEIDLDFQQFKRIIAKRIKGKQEVIISYRMRLGIK